MCLEAHGHFDLGLSISLRKASCGLGSLLLPSQLYEFMEILGYKNLYIEKIYTHNDSDFKANKKQSLCSVFFVYCLFAFDFCDLSVHVLYLCVQGEFSF